MGVRRKRIKPEQPQLLWDELGRLPIDTEPALTTARGKEVLALGEKHGLTVYHAAYLKLARRYQLPLGTLDGDLCKAAQAEGVPGELARCQGSAQCHIVHRSKTAIRQPRARGDIPRAYSPGIVPQSPSGSVKNIVRYISFQG